MNEYNNNEFINEQPATNAQEPETVHPAQEVSSAAGQSQSYHYGTEPHPAAGEYHYANPDAGKSFDNAYASSQPAGHGSYYNPYVSADSPVYSHDFTEKKTKQTRTRTRAGHGWLVALCIILSLVSGFGGAWTYSKLFAKEPVVITTVNEPVTRNQPASSGTQDLADVIAAAKECVVEITTEIVKTGSFFSQSITQGAGSGVIIDSDGYIATCYHVIQGASSITVTLPDGSSYTGTVYGYDSDNDLAVVKIDAHELPVAVMADSSKLRVGETVFAIGNPLGSLGGTVTDGIVSALDREVTVEGQAMTLLQTSAAVNHGNSGGGLFNSRGELIGIVNAKSAGEDVEGLGFAIPGSIVLESVTRIVDQGGSIPSNSPVMGVTVQEIYGEEAAKQYGVTRYGVYILNIEAGFGADKAGLKVKDCIVSVDDIAIEHNEDLTNLLKKHAVGDVIEVQVVRGNRLMTFEVELMPRKG